MDGQSNPEIRHPRLSEMVWSAFSDVFEASELTEEDIETMDDDEVLGAAYTASFEAGLDEDEIQERLTGAGITEEGA